MQNRNPFLLVAIELVYKNKRNNIFVNL